MLWKRVECIGENSRLTLWKNPEEEEELGSFQCRGQCGWLLPNGTRICWNYRCHAPANEAGYSDLVRMYSEKGDRRAIRNLAVRWGQRVSKAQLRRENAEQDVLRNETSVFGTHRNTTHDVRQGTPANSIPNRRLMSNAESSTEKKMKIAKKARRVQHPVYTGRCYYSHKERFDWDLEHGDHEYAETCQRNRHCREDGILWFQGTDNDTGAKRVWLNADEEVQRNLDRAAGSRPQAKFKPNRKDTRFTSGSYTKKRW